MRLAIAVNGGFVQPTIEAIRSSCAVGDDSGRIYVQELRDVIRVRTGERGKEAI